MVCLDNNLENVPLKPDSTIGAYVITIVSILLLISMTFYFYINRNISVILRRRPFHLLLMSTISMIVFLLVEFWRTISPNTLPCWFYFFIGFFITPAVLSPYVLRITYYSNALAMEDIKRKRMGSSIMLEDVSDWKAFLSYCKVKLSGTKNEEETIRAIIFPTRRAFAYLWILIFTIPFSVYYFINLIVLPNWQACTGCAFQLKDTLFVIIVIVFIVILGLISCLYLIKNDRNDPLYYVREFLYCWMVGGSTCLTSLILHQIDPGSVQASRSISFFWGIALTYIAMTFISTVLQVRRAKQNLAALLLRMNEEALRNKVDVKEILEDIKKDKEMKRSLFDHMQKELSSEILEFIIRVDEWRSFVSDPKNEHVSPGKNQRAREIYDEFIRPLAINEVNLSSLIKDALYNIFNGGGGANTITIVVFDKAYEEATNLLINDTLPRFIDKHKKVWAKQSTNTSTTTTTTTVEKISNNKTSSKENTPKGTINNDDEDAIVFNNRNVSVANMPMNDSIFI